MLPFRSEPRWMLLTKAVAVACALALHLAVLAAVLAQAPAAEPLRLDAPMQVSMVALLPGAAASAQKSESDVRVERQVSAVTAPVRQERAGQQDVRHEMAKRESAAQESVSREATRREPVRRRPIRHEPVAQESVPHESGVTKPADRRGQVVRPASSEARRVAVDKPSKASVRSVEPPVRADTAPGEAASGVHLATAASTTDAGARAAASASAASDQPRWVTRVAYLGGPPSPRYPAAAQRRGQTGKVVVRVLISPQGNVVNASIEKSSGHVLLDDAALDAVQRARFKPYTENGVAHSARADIPIDFVL